MANKKNTITRAQALEFAIANLDNAEVVEVLTKMHASITKPRPKTNEPSRAAKENARLAAEVLKVLPAGEPVLTSWIMEHVHGIMTAQKCTKVMAVLLDAGKVERVPEVQGRYTGYKLV
jgi:hypothetical protein